MKNKIHKYSIDEINFLKENANGKSVLELTSLFNKKFNLNLSYTQIASTLSRNKIKTNFSSGRFKKGENYAIRCGKIKIGSECVKSNGYVYVRTSENGDWKLKHHIIYENKYGKIKKGNKIKFLDGNKRNFDINNLFEITRQEQAIINSNNLCSDNPDITKTGILLARLKNKINEKSKINR